MMATSAETSSKVIHLEAATVRFCGDSGDGMQLAGTQLTVTSAIAGNDVATFPDYPAEIRAPRGTLAGVSGFQIHFSSKEIYTPGDEVNALVAMNPAALKTNLNSLVRGGILIVNSQAFDKKGLAQAGYEANPLEDGSLDSYQLFSVEMTALTRGAVEGLGLGTKEADRCRNFFAMGLVFWLYDRPLAPTLRYIEEKFGKRADVAEANIRALNTGFNYGETTDAIGNQYVVEKAELPAGTYRSITGNQAMALGLVAASKVSKHPIFFGTYPITPASDILHELAKFKNFGVMTYQAEDEIAAVTSSIGAAFAGAMGVTSSSGPGIALKGEAMGLAMILELPMIIINVQRGGPSTGLPTKTEQSDLFQVMFGRNGECPIPVLAARSPADCFDVAREAWKIATQRMTPVIVLSDGYLANGSEPWRIPDVEDFEPIEISHPLPPDNGEVFMPYARNERLGRPWALPGTPGLAHRIGGLEKQDLTGNVCYDPANHQHMTDLRARKVAEIATDIPKQTVLGPKSGEVLVLSWGGTYGACSTATRQLQSEGKSVAHAHLRYLNPMPMNLGELLSRYEKVLIPELNMGQLLFLIRGTYLRDAIGLHKVQGHPFAVAEITKKIRELLG